MRSATLALTIAAAGLAGPPAASPAEPQGLGTAAWIWSADGTFATGVSSGTRYFRLSFDVGERPLERAFAWFAADNRFVAFLNGHQLATGDDWRHPVRVGLRRHLYPGVNILAVRVTNDGPGQTPAGLLASICISYRDGQTVWHRSDSSWLVTSDASEGWTLPGLDAADWAPATEVCQHGDPPWGTLGPDAPSAAVPASFPTFHARGQQAVMDALRDLAYRHYRVLRAGATMWDAWLVPPSLWPATASRADYLRNQWRRALSERDIDPDGYVHTHQHFSYAHNAGWPFPIWTQAGLDPDGQTLTAGWHFHGPRADPMYLNAVKQLEGSAHVGPTATQGWTLHDLVVERVDDAGWHLRVVGDRPHLTSPGTRSFATSNAPFVQVRLRPAHPLREHKIGLGWCHIGDSDFSSDRRVDDRLVADDADAWVYHTFRLYDQPNWEGRIERIRVHLPPEPGQVYCLDSVFTVYDTRHPINNASFVIGACDYFRWTGDVAFLRANIDRLRHAMRFHVTELGIEEHGVIFVPWVGHDGRSGVTQTAAGRKRIHFGRGIGNNYFDLLPFGGFDLYATVQFCAAAEALAVLEDAIAQHATWRIVPPGTDWSAAKLRQLVEHVKTVARRKFWSTERGRFVGAIDVTGTAHDYGFTFVNLEAIHHGIADGQQARAILGWIMGKRTVAGDTSTAGDIYHWQFAPRVTTRRNLDWYNFAWNAPEELAWGEQVQDGGAVLGWSYYDLHARLQVCGPQNAWHRLREIVDWYEEVQEAGGYRKYYSQPGRGTLQGGGTAGGLGIDQEFLESALLIHFLLDGFMGFVPTPTGFSWQPRLPDALPTLRIDRVRYRGCVLALEASAKRLQIDVVSGASSTLTLELPAGEWGLRQSDAAQTPDQQQATDGEMRIRLKAGQSLVFERAPSSADR